MKKQTMATLLAPLVAGLILLAQGAAAQTADVHVVGSFGIQGVMEKILPEYERVSGHRITIDYGESAVLKRAVEQGNAFDLAILTPQVIDDLIKTGKIAAGTRTDIAKTDLAVGIRAGATRSDISTPDALKRRLLAAQSITYAKEGSATAAIERMFSRLGIADAVEPKTIRHSTAGRPSESVAEGKNELVLAPASAIVPVPGVQVLGLLPAEFQSSTVMTAGVGVRSKRPDVAKALVQFLTSPKAIPAINASGMESLAKK